jgi:hypothetical protein
MHARLVKETRPLLPVFALMLPLMIIPIAFWGGDGLDFAVVVLILGSVAMGAISFGTEFQHRTLPLLLVQPVSRFLLWRDKMLVVGTGVGLSLAIGLATLGFSRGLPLDRDFWLAAALAPLGAFCLAPYLTLLVRNTIGGVVFSLVLPATAGSTLMIVVERLLPGGMAREWTVLSLILISCPVACWLGYAKFKTLETLDTPSQDLALPAGVENAVTRRLREISARFTSPFARLVKKELRLQQVNFLLAGLFCIVAAAGACFYLLKRDSETPKIILGLDFAIYVGIIPLLVNVIAITEERSWGMADWQLTLPVSARKQWFAKILVTHLTSLVLGLLLPAALLLLGVLLVPDEDRPNLPPVHAMLYTMLFWMFGYVLLMNVAIYGASLSNNAVRGVLLAIGLMVAGGTMIAAGLLLADLGAIGFISAMWAPEALMHENFVVLFALAGTFVLVCLLQQFAFGNYRHRYLAVREMVVQVLVLLVILCLLTAVLFFPAVLAAQPQQQLHISGPTHPPTTPPCALDALG